MQTTKTVCKISTVKFNKDIFFDTKKTNIVQWKVTNQTQEFQEIKYTYVMIA